VSSERFLPSLRRFVSFEELFARFVALPSAPWGRFGAILRHYGPNLLRENGSGHQVSHAHQVVGCASEGKNPIHLQRSAMPHLAQ